MWEWTKQFLSSLWGGGKKRLRNEEEEEEEEQWRRKSKRRRKDLCEERRKIDISKENESLYEEFFCFPFLNDLDSIRNLQSSRTLLILRGLPGSGKSCLAAKIKQIYPQAQVCTADPYILQQDGQYRFDKTRLGEVQKACQERVENLCQGNTNLIVVDNTHVRRWEFQPYINIASTFRYCVMLVEPQTPWSKDYVELSKRSQHRVRKQVVCNQLGLWQVVVPRYYCWQLNIADSHLLLLMARQFIQTAFLVSPNLSEQFQLETRLDSGSQSSPLENYSSQDMLHCTALFLKHGMEVERQVEVSVGMVSELTIRGFTLTTDTFGARVCLGSKELKLWGQEDELTLEGGINYVGGRCDSVGGGVGTLPGKRGKEGEAVGERRGGGAEKGGYIRRSGRGGGGGWDGRSSPVEERRLDLETAVKSCRSSVYQRMSSTPSTSTSTSTSILGQRAHITLGCAHGVKPVKTGLDQISLLRGEVESEEIIPGGRLHRVRGVGWIFHLDQDLRVGGMFAGVY